MAPGLGRLIDGAVAAVLAVEATSNVPTFWGRLAY
jgi:hypothetical protein